MVTSKVSKSVLAGNLVAAVALAGSAHAAVYSSEGFEAGTPNYSINGINGTGAGESWFKLPDGTGSVEPNEAVAGTGYDAGASSRVGVVANGDPTDISPAGEPTGQHGFVSTSANRTLTSNYAMTLASDGAVSLDISLSYMFYALEDANTSARGSAIVLYSANGLFDDSVQLLSFGFGEAGSLVETPDFGATEDTWQSLSASFTEAGAGITFTDTAALRINRVPLVGTTSPDTNTNHITFLDDITVEGVVPEPGSLALLGLGGLIIARRRR